MLCLSMEGEYGEDLSVEGDFANFSDPPTDRVCCAKSIHWIWISALGFTLKSFGNI